MSKKGHSRQSRREWDNQVRQDASTAGMSINHYEADTGSGFDTRDIKGFIVKEEAESTGKASSYVKKGKADKTVDKKPESKSIQKAQNKITASKAADEGHSNLKNPPVGARRISGNKTAGNKQLQRRRGKFSRDTKKKAYSKRQARKRNKTDSSYNYKQKAAPIKSRGRKTSGSKVRRIFVRNRAYLKDNEGRFGFRVSSKDAGNDKKNKATPDKTYDNKAQSSRDRGRKTARNEYKTSEQIKRNNILKEENKSDSTKDKTPKKSGSDRFDFKAPKKKKELFRQKVRKATFNVYEKKAEEAGERAESVRTKPNRSRRGRKRVHLVRYYDESTGTGRYGFRLDGEIRRGRKTGISDISKKAGRKFSYSLHQYVHNKVSEHEKENSAVEGVHKSERQIEKTFAFVVNRRRSRMEKLESKLARYEKQQAKYEVNARYHRFLAENPEFEKKAIQKRLQKLRIKREYAKALQRGESAKEAAHFAQSAVKTTTLIARKIQEIIRSNITLIGSIAIAFILIVIIMTAISSCGAMLMGGLANEMAGSYQSLPAEMDGAEMFFTELEANLQDEINNVETTHPGYDEYNYNIDPIGHDPFILMNYLSAQHLEFLAADVESELQDIFNSMYNLTFTERTEVRGTEPDTYTVRILDVRLSVVPLGNVVESLLNDDTRGLYEAYQVTNGALQRMFKPIDLYWYNYVSSYYGQRKDMGSGDTEIHRGIDISVPAGTDVLAAHDGTITEVGSDAHFGSYIVIEDSQGYTTKYGHLDGTDVSEGQAVTHGDIIGQTGSTGNCMGSGLHLELLYNGEYYNPLFYFEAGTGTLYGEPATGTSPPPGGGTVTDREPYDDATVEALISEAERYLGMPYTFGGTPPSSFDCSAFVCWAFTNSGVHNLPRTTAQGIYDQCDRVSQADAKPGDIIFFTGTYDAGRPVTHVGIYAGNGQMIHCGDPIKYASINTPYWQQHFYGFGRLN